MAGSIRAGGIKKLAAGAVALVVISWFLLFMQRKGHTPGSFALIGLGTPVAIGLVGLLEIMLNRPFAEMEVWWNELKKWQRGVIGILTVIAAFTLLISGMATAGLLGLI